eukprot:CAMPEP_0173404794 /NCGR_PEP_ID=MMETSP1356-20130122/60271_1 /TAXON_ID=77927 ORGANISM="Hemiselmis virescens, Strain PCC157" /NCGR_SAMPLE_ID=MMETSP1356 /ASSEMBLY_ACC=CAM_ASM_000847 /LENGTH=64 /DNA_ID=CAMNT_0014365521 /DNA_START=402 /DNA_END=593 /DNA_ORIENTATION=+
MECDSDGLGGREDVALARHKELYLGLGRRRVRREFPPRVGGGEGGSWGDGEEGKGKEEGKGASS